MPSLLAFNHELLVVFSRYNNHDECFYINILLNYFLKTNDQTGYSDRKSNAPFHTPFQFNQIVN